MNNQRLLHEQWNVKTRGVVSGAKVNPHLLRTNQDCSFGGGGWGTHLDSEKRNPPSFGDTPRLLFLFVRGVGQRTSTLGKSVLHPVKDTPKLCRSSNMTPPQARKASIGARHDFDINKKRFPC